MPTRARSSVGVAAQLLLHQAVFDKTRKRFGVALRYLTLRCGSVRVPTYAQHRRRVSGPRPRQLLGKHGTGHGSPRHCQDVLPTTLNALRKLNARRAGNPASDGQRFDCALSFV